MNKKGFTLVELLGVIVLLGVLGIIAVSTIDKNIKEGRIKTCKTQEKNIIEGAKAYILDHQTPTSTSGSEIITVQALEADGYIKDNLINPVTDQEYGEKAKVIVTNNNYKYTYKVCYTDEKVACKDKDESANNICP